MVVFERVREGVETLLLSLQLTAGTGIAASLAVAFLGVISFVDGLLAGLGFLGATLGIDAIRRILCGQLDEQQQ